MKIKLPISIIVPVYNEGSNIAFFIHALEKAVKIKHEVLIVYDFDEDNTIPVAKKLQRQFPNIKLTKNNLGSGLINACKTGIIQNKGDFIVIMPGDLADDPQTINQMYELAKKGFDIICATRYSRGGKKEGGVSFKSILSRLAGITTPLILGIPTSDLTNGYKMYKRIILEKIAIKSTGGWEFTMEVLIKAHLLGFKITETPSTWKERHYGKSKFKLFCWLPRYIYWYWWGINQRIMEKLKAFTS